MDDDEKEKLKEEEEKAMCDAFLEGLELLNDDEDDEEKIQERKETAARDAYFDMMREQARRGIRNEDTFITKTQLKRWGKNILYFCAAVLFFLFVAWSEGHC